MTVLKPKISISDDNHYELEPIEIKKIYNQNIDKNYVISRNLENNIVSTYCDDIWDFSMFKTSNSNRNGLFDFLKNIKHTSHISDVKYLMFLLLCYGSGRNNSFFSISTLSNYFRLFKNISIYAYKNKISIINIFSNEYHLLEVITTYQKEVKHISSFLNLLLKKTNPIKKGTNYDKAFSKLQEIRKKKKQDENQTLLIPSRILLESIQQRWEQIYEVSDYIKNLNGFLSEYIENISFAISRHDIYSHKNKNIIILFEDAMSKYNLTKLFTKYNIKNRKTFHSFINKIQQTCFHLIIAYSGMRKEEALSLTTDCIKRVNGGSNVVRLLGITTKISGTNKEVSWVTIKEVELIIDILRNFNRTITSKHNIETKKCPLFINIKSISNREKYVFKTKSISDNLTLPLDKESITINKKDKNELIELEFGNLKTEIQIGQTWHFTFHQYRRSLAVYAILSGLVSLGTLQRQFKHLFREMTLYYTNGAAYAKQLFEVGMKEHIARKWKNIEEEMQVLSLIKDVIYSEEPLHGRYGMHIENNVRKNNNKSYHSFLLKNRAETLNKIRKGEMIYKTTPLGGCTSIKECEYRIQFIKTACIKCDGSIIKLSNLDNTISLQNKYLESLEINSLEYKSEAAELKELKKLRKNISQD